MSFRDCINRAVEAGKAKARKAKEALEHFDRLVRENIENGMGRQQAEEAAALAATAQVEAGKKADRLRKLKQARNQTDLFDRINDARDSKGRKAPWAMLSELTDELDGRRDAIRGVLHGSISDLLYKHGYKGIGLTRKRAGLSNIVRETYRGGTTGDNAAASLAKAVKETQNLVVDLLRNEGVDVTPDPDWHLPQMHDPVVIYRAGKTRWVEDHLNTVDWSRMKHYNNGMAILPGERQGVLESVYDTLVTDGASKITEPGTGGAKSLGKLLASRRFIRYKDADSWLKMQKKYGQSDAFEQVVTYFDTVASDIAMVQLLGADPGATNRFIIDAVRKAAADMDAANFGGSKLRSASSKAGVELKRVWEPAFELMQNSNAMTRDTMLATAAAGTRNMVISSLLGSTPLVAAPGDIMTSINTLKFNGMPAAKFVGRYASMLNPASAKDRRIALRSGMIAENLIGRSMAAERFTGEAFSPGWTRAFSDVSLRLAGLNQITQAGRWAMGMEMMGAFADFAGRTFDRLDPMLRESMARYRIGPEEWDMFRSTAVFDEEGYHLLRPKDLLTRTDIDRSAAIEAFNRFQTMVSFETKRGIPEATLRSRAFFGLNNAGGTVPGELLKSIALLKNFPVATMYLHIMPFLNQAMHKGRPQYLAAFTLGMMGAGALSVQLGQITNGKDPLDMIDKRFWGQAMLKGGGLGIYGDFLFSDLNRYGGGMADTLAGPVWQFMQDATNLTFGNMAQALNGEDTKFTAEALRFVNNWAPGTRLWYLRLIKERMLINTLEEQVDPRAHQRWRAAVRRAQRERSQEYFWAPGEAIPRRMPAVGAALGE